MPEQQNIEYKSIWKDVIPIFPTHFSVLAILRRGSWYSENERAMCRGRITATIVLLCKFGVLGGLPQRHLLSRISERFRIERTAN